jgi:hypothetical protein
LEEVDSQKCWPGNWGVFEGGKAECMTMQVTVMDSWGSILLGWLGDQWEGCRAVPLGRMKILTSIFQLAPVRA